MKVVLLAGGFGSRISEESQFKPKPMIEICGMPILWHIMKEYAYYGYNEFIICAGYKQEYIKEWFANYFLYNSDVSFNFRNGKNEITVHHSNLEPWKVTIVDTGYNTLTGGRIKRIKEYVNNETFMMTYGDGVCDVDINKLVAFHKKHGKIATLTAVIQAQDKGVLNIDENNYSIESHNLLDFYNRKTKREICYYKSTTSENFIKVEGQLDDIKRYLLSYGEGLLINKKEHSALLNNLTLVQKGKLFGHYCLSKEEEEELEYITDEPELTTNCYE